jgi:hypothetical protein
MQLGKYPSLTTTEMGIKISSRENYNGKKNYENFLTLFKSFDSSVKELEKHIPDIPAWISHIIEGDNFYRSFAKRRNF